MYNKNFVLKFLHFVIPTFILVFTLNVESTAQNKQRYHMFEKVVDSLNFPEGPAWDGEGNLYVSSCYGGYIIKISHDGISKFDTASVNPFTLKQTNGLTVGKDGFIYACDFGIGAILKISKEGKTEIYSKGYNGKKFNRPNDLAFDPDGNLYITDPKSYDKNNADGVVYRIDSKSRETIPAADSIAFPNGIAFAPDGKSVFVCESARHRVLKFKLSKNGKLIDRSAFINLPGGDPDGIAFDSLGNLYIAHFGGGNIYVVSPGGMIIDTIKTPGKKVSNLEFAGEDLKTLYITEDETNAVYKMQSRVPGFPLFYSTLNNKNRKK